MKAIEQVNNNIEVGRTNITKVVKDEMSAVLQDASATNGTGLVFVGKDNVRDEVKAAMDDEKERHREFRTRNLFFAGVPEPDTDDLNVGKAEDLDFVNVLLNQHMELEQTEYKVRDTTRMYGDIKSSGNWVSQDCSECILMPQSPLAGWPELHPTSVNQRIQ